MILANLLTAEELEDIRKEPMSVHLHEAHSIVATLFDLQQQLDAANRRIAHLEGDKAATAFLDDRFATPAEVSGLAQAIQTAIEGWLEDHPPNENKLKSALRDFKRVQMIADSIREKKAER